MSGRGVQSVPTLPHSVPSEQVEARAGEGPLITDDRPLPEYFLVRRLFGWGRE